MPKILYFVPEDWVFVSHFRPMAQAALACGLDVVIATRVHRHAEAIVGQGYKLVPLESKRGSLNPLALLKSIAEMARIVRREQPTIVHCVSLPMAVLGGLAARATGRRQIVLALTGLGYVWIERGPVAIIVRAIVRQIMGYLLRHPGTVCVFENAEDPREFGLDRSNPKVVLVGGAGVDPQAFQCGPEPPAPPVKIALLSRMIKPKGIAEAVAAVRRARELGAAVELHLYGAPDPSNRTSYTEADLRRWASDPGIHWHGATDDVTRVHREHHIVMLLSVREGLPKALVEAAAAGRSSRPMSRGAGRSSVRGAKVIWCRSAISVPPRRRWWSLRAIRRCGCASARPRMRGSTSALRSRPSRRFSPISTGL